MILDSLERLGNYHGLHPLFAQADRALQQMMKEPPEPGKHVLDGDRLFIIVAQDQGRGPVLSDLEFHRRYIDIQLVLRDHDVMGWRSLETCTQLRQAYDPARDIGFYADHPQLWLQVPAGHFTIFYPHDAHAPLATTGRVMKAVVKVAVEP